MGDEKKVADYFSRILVPKDIGLKQAIKVSSVKRLGKGTGNLNYLVVANKKKFVFRLNMDVQSTSRKEYESLKLIEKYAFGPKAWYIDSSRKHFDSDLLILEYLEGTTVDKLSEYLQPPMIRKIASLCAELHSVRLSKVLQKLDKTPETKGCKQYHANLKKHYLTYIQKKLHDKKLLEIITTTYAKLGKMIPASYEADLVLTQGDFCEQNVISYKGTYKLIDFEDLGITDRSAHLAQILVDFGRPFEEKEKELFMNVYCRETHKDKQKLLEKINVLIPLKIFEVFLWSVKHNLKIKHKEMHASFFKNHDVAKDINYAKIMFKRNIRFNTIDKQYQNFDIEKVFSPGKLFNG